MIRRFIPIGLVIGLLAPAVIAQNKISGTEQCGKPNPLHVVPVTGMPNHSLAVLQLKCTWTKPMVLAGIETKDSVETETYETIGNTGHAHGYHVTTMANGDMFRSSYSETGTHKEGAVQSTKGTWTFLSGTSNLKGIKGKGTFECNANADGYLCNVEGEYTLPK